ncbi:MAG: hypothetical protein E3J72_22300 [Planctomycetota bacterium]|nr:MAG: hypothetical protein E3J72_22300 [Planctomycetota bacterium]
MRTTFSIAYADNGKLRMRVSGKLTGHSAREGLELLKTAAMQGKREIVLDLRKTTSLDSLGFAMFDWIREQNGNLNVSIIPPVLGIGEEELAIITQIAGTEVQEKQCNNTAKRRERA